MKRFALVGVGLIAILPLAARASSASFDESPSPISVRATVEDRTTTRDGEEGCTIAYYDHCSGWVNIWPGSNYVFGVVFDLPADCGAGLDLPCENTSFAWWWWDTKPGYGFTVTYSMYESDSLGCLIGEPIGILAGQEPVEGWNEYPGLGIVESERIVITAVQDNWLHPTHATDNPDFNQNVGCGTVSEETHSALYGDSFLNIDCPPELLLDAHYYPCHLLMDATFSCQSTSTEPTSWGAVKRLFR